MPGVDLLDEVFNLMTATLGRDDENVWNYSDRTGWLLRYSTSVRTLQVVENWLERTVVAARRVWGRRNPRLYDYIVSQAHYLRRQQRHSEAIRRPFPFWRSPSSG